MVDELFEAQTGAEAPADDCENWREVCLHRTEELEPLLNELHASLAALDFSRSDCGGVCLALEEAVVNALKHGNQGDACKCVLVSFRADAESVLVRVEDEGQGFDPASVPDPTAPENLDKPSGRGQALMRFYVSWVCYRGRGNTLILCKYRQSPAGPSDQ